MRPRLLGLTSVLLLLVAGVAAFVSGIGHTVTEIDGVGSAEYDYNLAISRAFTIVAILATVGSWRIVPPRWRWNPWLIVGFIAVALLALRFGGSQFAAWEIERTTIYDPLFPLPPPTITR